jgi:pyruvate-formate lyase-activating enzyme
VNRESYPSCEWIEGGLAFNRASLHTCLIVHHRTGLPFVADYRGGRLPFETLLRVREEIRAANQRGGHPECRGCPHLKTRLWPRSRYPITIVGIAHYAYCNIKCSYCFLQTQDPASFAAGLKPYSLVPAIRELIECGHLAPDAIIDWGGGEPTSYPEFDELLTRLLDHGTFHYLHTNGTRFPPAVRQAPRRVHVICSVDAGLPETYRRIKEKDYLERVWRVLEEYVRAGSPVSLKYIVKDQNCGDADLEAFIHRAARIGARELIVDIDYDFPEPSAEVVTALGRLRALARHARLPSRFGFTGANFAPEHGVAARAEEAFRAEWRRCRGSWATRLARLAGSTLARIGLGPIRGPRRLRPTTPSTEAGGNATAQTGTDEPDGLGRRLWHLPVTTRDRDPGD